MEPKKAHRFLKKHGIDGLKDLKVYVDSVHLQYAEPERLAYVCWGRAGTGEFSTQALYVNVTRNRRGRAVAETFCVVFEPSEYPDHHSRQNTTWRPRSMRLQAPLASC